MEQWKPLPGYENDYTISDHGRVKNSRTFIGVEEVALPGGKIITRGISTTTLSVDEMSQYLDRIDEFAADTLGLEITT